MTQSFINPLSKFTSDTLQTLPYSRLYFYENQSSTPKQIYKDKNKTISWGVYAESDSAGNFAPIWYDGVARAELRWSPNWLTTPVGTVQTGWPIDWIGTAQTFDTSIVINGSVTANGVISTTSVAAAGNAGFVSTTYNSNAQNPIWSFGNAPTYGISYFAGTPSLGVTDYIGFHFGTATILGSEFLFDDDGNFTCIGSASIGSPGSPASTIRGGLNLFGDIVTNGNINAVNFNASNGITTIGNAAIGGSMVVSGNFGAVGTINSNSSVSAGTGLIPGNTTNASANVLDYYLEGTFTPVVLGATTAGTGTYTNQIGKYTRIGNTVFFSLRVTWTAHTGTGNTYISGLPFTAFVGLAEPVLSVLSDSLVVGSNKQLCAVVGSGGTTIIIKTTDVLGGSAGFIAIENNFTDVYISGQYFV